MVEWQVYQTIKDGDFTHWRSHRAWHNFMIQGIAEYQENREEILERWNKFQLTNNWISRYVRELALLEAGCVEVRGDMEEGEIDSLVFESEEHLTLFLLRWS